MRDWIIFSDLQLKEDRLEDQKKVLEYITDIDTRKFFGLIFLGDGFENRKSVTAEMLKIYSDFFEDMHYRLKKIIIVAGNHDKPYNDAEYSFFRPFRRWNNVEVVENKYFIGVFNNLFIPYFSEKKMFAILSQMKNDTNIKTMKERIEYIFMHYGLDGVPLDSGKLTKSNITFDLLKSIFPKLKKVISGHYHNRRKYLKGKINYIGNPIALSHNEEEDKGIHFFNDKTGVLNFFDLELPRFKTLKSNCGVNYIKAVKEMIEVSENEFLRVIFTDEKEKLAAIPEAELKKYAEKFKLQSFKIIKNPFGKESVEDSDIIIQDNIKKVFIEYSQQENMNKFEFKYGMKKLKESI